MDRRRLEAAHLRYACLMMAASYPDQFKGFSFEGDINDTLERITPKLFQIFEQTYSRKYVGRYISTLFHGDICKVSDNFTQRYKNFTIRDPIYDT